MSKIKTFKEIQFDFLVPESWIYHLDLTESLPTLFNNPSDAAFPIAMAKKLATLCITLNEYPNIRFQKSSVIATNIANKLNSILQDYKRVNPKFIAFGEDNSADRERGQMIIIDRMFDPLTPLMHEYTYQAMANDLLVLDEDGMISYETTNERGTKIPKKAILNSESDELWIEHRHKHIAKVISSLKERMDDILSTNAGAKLAKNKNKGEVDMTTMASAVKNLPQYQQLMTDLGRHVAVASLCMKEFNEQKLIEISNIEQILSTGLDDEGKEVKRKKIVEMVVSFFTSNSGVAKDLKIRLLLIYFVTQRPISTEERKQVIGSARLNNVDQQAIYKMSNLLDITNYDTEHNSLAASANSVANPVAASKTGFFSSIFGRGVREAEKIASSAEGDYTDTRHVSAVKVIIEQSINGQLSVDKFGSIGPNMPNNSEAKIMAQSARKFKTNNRWEDPKNKVLLGGRIMMFVAGGISYAEMRDGYDVMNKELREVIVGGSHITTPAEYINDILKIEN